jgi:3-hydroxyisobutyrate dehydrogenase-like beta-hydroxyacid dehydrogenase
MRIGCIGLGRIGLMICRKLADAGHDLIVHDVEPQSVARALSIEGAHQASCPAETAAQSEAVMISVPGPAEDAEVMLGPSGVLAGARAGLLIVDTTTSAVAQSRDLARQAAERGLDYLDAPMSIAQQGDAAETLTIMTGGEPRAFERARPLLECFATHVRHVGPSGSGTAIKLINQAIYVTYLAAFAEGLALGERAGFTRDVPLDVLATSAAGNPRIAGKYGEIRGLSNDRFAIDSALRYLGLGREAFSNIGPATPTIDAATASLGAASKLGLGEKDVIVARHDYLSRDA